MAVMDELSALRTALARNPDGYEENRDLGLRLARHRTMDTAAEGFIRKALARKIHEKVTAAP